jgi:RimJ/RimL family protein N-acetyltransferase
MKDVQFLVLPPDRWRESKALRLEALQEAPSAFAASYAEEAAYDDELWQRRLQAASERDGNLDYFSQRQGELVGMAGASWSNRSKLRHGAFIYGVYVSPRSRGIGIASALMRTLLDELADTLRFEKVSLTVTSEGLAAIRLYEKLGFAIVGTSRRDFKLADRYYDQHFMELHFDETRAGPGAQSGRVC